MPALSRLYSSRIIRTAVFAVLVLAAVVSVFQGVRNAFAVSQDFQWDAAKALCSGLDPYELSIYPERALEDPDLARFYAMFTDQGLKQKMEANQFPSLLLLLAPMTLFPPETAKIVWCILNLVFTAGIALLLRRTFFEDVPGYGFAAAVLITLAGTPYRNQIGVGQHTLFAFFFFMIAVWTDKKKPLPPVADSVLIALALFISFFKYTLTAPLALYFLHRKRYRELAAAAAGHVILTGVCALYMGKSFVYMIKAPLEVASRLVSEGGIDLGVLFGGFKGYAAAFVIIAVLTVIIYRLPEGYEKAVMAVLILWSLVLTYHRTYDFFVLSAVAMVFSKKDGMRYNRYFGRYIAVWYAVLVLLVYFVLRIFDENAVSKICTAIVYYAFTLYVTYALICTARSSKEQTAGAGN